jgi:hypothetical protein
MNNINRNICTRKPMSFQGNQARVEPIPNGTSRVFNRQMANGWRDFVRSIAVGRETRHCFFGHGGTNSTANFLFAVLKECEKTKENEMREMMRAARCRCAPISNSPVTCKMVFFMLDESSDFDDGRMRDSFSTAMPREI